MLRATLQYAHRLFHGIPRHRLLLLCLMLIALLSGLDFITGYEVSFSIFYLIPVTLAAQYGRAIDAHGIALVSAAAWMAMDKLAGHPYSSQWIPVWNAIVRLGFFLIIGQMVIDLRQRIHEQHTLARTDALTGIMNRLAFQESVQQLLQLARRQQQAVSLAYIDVDNFKTVNDQQGHDEGDKVLRVIATGLRDSLRTSDLVARLGGDEFALFLPDTNSEEAAIAVSKARDHVMAIVKKQQWPITLSIGLVSFQQAPTTLSAVLGKADQLMYRVKTTGKNAITQENA